MRQKFVTFLKMRIRKSPVLNCDAIISQHCICQTELLHLISSSAKRLAAILMIATLVLACMTGQLRCTNLKVLVPDTGMAISRFYRHNAVLWNVLSRLVQVAVGHR